MLRLRDRARLLTLLRWSGWVLLALLRWRGCVLLTLLWGGWALLARLWWGGRVLLALLWCARRQRLSGHGRLDVGGRRGTGLPRLRGPSATGTTLLGR